MIHYRSVTVMSLWYCYVCTIYASDFVGFDESDPGDSKCHLIVLNNAPYPNYAKMLSFSWPIIPNLYCWHDIILLHSGLALFGPVHADHLLLLAVCKYNIIITLNINGAGLKVAIKHRSNNTILLKLNNPSCILTCFSWPVVLLHSPSQCDLSPWSIYCGTLALWVY